MFAFTPHPQKAGNRLSPDVFYIDADKLPVYIDAKSDMIYMAVTRLLRPSHDIPAKINNIIDKRHEVP